MTNWLSAGIKFVTVLANYDEMAIGATQAQKAIGRPMDQVIVAGIDATQDAMASMKAGDLDIRCSRKRSAREQTPSMLR